MALYIGIGSNLGNRLENIEAALNKINDCVGQITAQSAIYETEPWGFSSSNKFLNMAIEVETTLTPSATLFTLQKIESELGRVRKDGSVGYSSRPIDLDILFFDTLIIDLPSLKIPHPLMAQRLFVLQPLNDICPNFVHPILNRSVGNLFSDMCKKEAPLVAISIEKRYRE